MSRCNEKSEWVNNRWRNPISNHPKKTHRFSYRPTQSSYFPEESSQRDKGEDRGKNNVSFTYPLSNFPKGPTFFSLLLFFLFSFIHTSPFLGTIFLRPFTSVRTFIGRGLAGGDSWFLRRFKCHGILRDKKEGRRGEGRKGRVSWGPVSIYVNYRGGRKSRSPRCSVGKVGKGWLAGWLAFPEPTRARWIKAVINYAIIQTTLPPYVFEIKTVFFASMRIIPFLRSLSLLLLLLRGRRASPTIPRIVVRFSFRLGS